jgi:uncharacterized membrane protein
MDNLPLHPKLVHLPIALAILVPVIAALILLAWWRGKLPRWTWWGAVALQGALVLSGLAARQSGEDDEEKVERLVPEAALEAHEEAAGAFVIASAVVLALGIAGGVVRAPGVARGLAGATVAGTLIVAWFGYRVGAAGGELVYRHGAAAAFATPAGGAPPPAGARADDDD